MIYTIVLYASEIWTTTISDEQKVDIFKRKVFVKILFGQKKNRSTRLWELWINLELWELFSEADIEAMLKSKRISWTGHIWRAQDQTRGNNMEDPLGH